jgi:hypothetical protein
MGRFTMAFALASSGLLLTGVVKEAAARKGNLGGELGGRRGNDHRGRDQRNRRNRGKNDNRGNNPPRAGGSLGNPIMVRVSNLRGQPVEIQGWLGGPSFQGDLWTIGNGWHWTTLPAKPSSGSAAAKDFEFEFQELAVQIGNDRFVHCFLRNGAIGTAIWPFVYEPRPTSDQFGYHERPGAGVLAYSNDLREGSSFSTSGITVTRLTNAGRTRWLAVDLK